MAQYRGTIEGSRGQASRLGAKTSGLTTTTKSWTTETTVYYYWDETAQEDCVRITVRKMYGNEVTIFDGPESKLLKKIIRKRSQW